MRAVFVLLVVFIGQVFAEMPSLPKSPRKPVRPAIMDNPMPVTPMQGINDQPGDMGAPLPAAVSAPDPVVTSPAPTAATAGESPVDVVMMKEIDDVVSKSDSAVWRERQKWFQDAGSYLAKIDKVFGRAQDEYSKREAIHRKEDKTLADFYINASDVGGKAARVVSDLTVYVERKLDEYAKQGCVQARGVLPQHKPLDGGKPETVGYEEIAKDDAAARGVVFVDEKLGQVPAERICSTDQKLVVDKLEALSASVNELRTWVDKLKESQIATDTTEDSMRESLYTKMKDGVYGISKAYGQAELHRNDIPHVRSNTEAQALFDKVVEDSKSAEKIFAEMIEPETQHFDQVAGQLSVAFDQAKTTMKTTSEKMESLRALVEEVGALEERLAGKEEKEIAKKLVPEVKPEVSAEPSRMRAVGAVIKDVAVMAWTGAKDFVTGVIGYVRGTPAPAQAPTEEPKPKSAFKEALSQFASSVVAVFKTGAEYLKSSYQSFKASREPQAPQVAPAVMDENVGSISEVPVMPLVGESSVEVPSAAMTPPPSTVPLAPVNDPAMTTPPAMPVAPVQPLTPNASEMPMPSVPVAPVNDPAMTPPPAMPLAPADDPAMTS